MQRYRNFGDITIVINDTKGVPGFNAKFLADSEMAGELVFDGTDYTFNFPKDENENDIVQGLGKVLRELINKSEQ